MKFPLGSKRGRQRYSETPTSRVLYLPRTVISATHEYFLPYWQARVEVAAFWAGLELGETQVVTTVSAPGQLQTPGNYQITRESLRRIAKSLSVQGLRVLSQVHTHPSDWVGHSFYDDEHAYSTSDGSLSLVWPNYGNPNLHSLGGVGIYERQEGKWVQLSSWAAAKRVKVVDSFVDARWQIVGGISDVE